LKKIKKYLEIRRLFCTSTVQVDLFNCVTGLLYDASYEETGKFLDKKWFFVPPHIAQR